MPCCFILPVIKIAWIFSFSTEFLLCHIKNISNGHRFVNLQKYLCFIHFLNRESFSAQAKGAGINSGASSPMQRFNANCGGTFPEMYPFACGILCKSSSLRNIRNSTLYHLRSLRYLSTDRPLPADGIGQGTLWECNLFCR